MVELRLPHPHLQHTSCIVCYIDVGRLSFIDLLCLTSTVADDFVSDIMETMAKSIIDVRLSSELSRWCGTNPGRFTKPPSSWRPQSSIRGYSLLTYSARKQPIRLF